ncbi:hypothetical protein EVAR_81681_1 [Eumeta japonica]|uniref:Uncharacterized protein n=1 Tax=Eumeta variegata TaxID=151549 RepID=A0A4C1V272_EUMVA|nr:hypothetical protein EVAR_81681_1 [Eumeta japonica]
MMNYLLLYGKRVAEWTASATAVAVYESHPTRRVVHEGRRTQTDGGTIPQAYTTTSILVQQNCVCRKCDQEPKEYKYPVCTTKHSKCSEYNQYSER